ncbi:hypothetical protein PHLCEN_2v12289 [Hermanssonia centrifuga]|uniref:Uncharacterized protein n=1 Tax=Hermanssonia centrifuga TaxID=98765 RepID=A0A2R6NHR2_9APHY|nr:hypothetical protein PHLCEN_2v12289 [Hermanssonia centrifuga]
MPPSSNPVIASRSSAERERGSTITSKDHRRKSSLEASIVSLSISNGSSASSDSGGSSETTVISDGFTDYLSDESDAELQRQAEIKAALLAQTHMEEQEFKAARQQLANIDLHPPKSWTSNVNAMPRSMNASSSNAGSAYRPQSLVSSSYLAAQSGSHSRV